MSLNRGKFGIEWNPRQDEKKPSGLKWVFLAVGLVALVSFSVTHVKRLRAKAAEGAGKETRVAVAPEKKAEAKPKTAASEKAPPAPDAAPVEIPKSVRQAETERQRPARVRNLLARLSEAERRKDVEMAVSTIEQLRALPGEPAADLDGDLAHRLGVLNMKRLFVKKSKLWVRQVEVKRGDSASRLAAEHGSTFASLVRLNGGDVETIRVGQKLYVMDHPRFSLVVHRRSRTADLLLKDKFFKRYDVAESQAGKDGAYELPRGTASFLRSLGLKFKAPDQTELELLLPVGSSIIVSEL